MVRLLLPALLLLLRVSGSNLSILFFTVNWYM